MCKATEVVIGLVAIRSTFFGLIWWISFGADYFVYAVAIGDVQ